MELARGGRVETVKGLGCKSRGFRELNGLWE
jgi:hypothetical protein